MKKKTIATRLPLLLLLLSLLYCTACANILPGPAPSLSPAAADMPAAPNPAPAIPAPSSDPIPAQGNEELLEALQERYGIELYYNADLHPFPQPFQNVAIYPVKDEELARAFLLLLDAQLSRYPKDFFLEAKRAGNTFRFFASDQILSLNAEAFAQYNGYYENRLPGGTAPGGNNIAIDAGKLQDTAWPDEQTPSGSIIEYVLHHEIGHAIADYIFLHMESSPFDLSLWYETYLPEAYRYYDMQTPQERAAMPLLQFGAPYVSEGSIWFPDIYAQNGLQEHLASLFAYAMMPAPPYEWKSENVQKQIACYFPLIREAFATEAWPAVTAWEQTALDAQ